MLTHLGTTLPHFTSPAAMPAGLQCALRTDTRGQVRLSAGLPRGMRLHRHREMWQELAHADWLELPDVRSVPMRLRLLDATVPDQAPGRHIRCRAAHWALHPAPLALPAARLHCGWPPWCWPHTPPPTPNTAPTWTSSPVRVIPHSRPENFSTGW